MPKLNEYVIGYTTNKGVLLDLDHTTENRVIMLADYLFRKYGLEGYQIMQSSTHNYHVIFNKPVTWTHALSIMAMATYIFKKDKLVRWVILQTIKQSATLRLTQKMSKPSPRLVLQIGKTDKTIKEYNEMYRVINE